MPQPKARRPHRPRSPTPPPGTPPVFQKEEKKKEEGGGKMAMQSVQEDQKKDPGSGPQKFDGEMATTIPETNPSPLEPVAEMTAEAEWERVLAGQELPPPADEVQHAPPQPAVEAAIWDLVEWNDI